MITPAHIPCAYVHVPTSTPPTPTAPATTTAPATPAVSVLQTHEAELRALGATDVTATGVDSLRVSAPPTTDRILHDVISPTIKGVSIDVPVSRSGENPHMPPRPTTVHEAVDLLANAHLPGVREVLANSTRWGDPSIIVHTDSGVVAQGLSDLLRDQVAGANLVISSPREL